MSADHPFSLWLEFEEIVQEADWESDRDFSNVEVQLPDGRRYSLNVWTFGVVARIREECAETGESLGGRYLEPPDLFVERLDRGLLSEVVTDLLENDALKEEWLCDEDSVS